MKSERGSALIAGLVISLVFVGLLMWFFGWSRTMSHGMVKRGAGKQAIQLADSAVNDAMKRVKEPDFFDGGPVVRWTSESDYGAYDITLVRSGINVSLVDAYATGYYYLPAGNATYGGKRAQLAAVHAKIQLSTISDFFAAVPGDLHVGMGSDLSGASVYARNLTFEKNAGPRTKVGRAYYSESVRRSDTGAVDDSPDFVDFDTSISSYALRLPSAPNLTTLDATTKNYYKNLAWANNGNPYDPFVGTVAAPPSGPPAVYFIDHDIELGSDALPFTVNGAYIIYTTGKVTIKNDILMASNDTNNCWLSILAEKDIVIGAEAPNNLTLNGTYVTNGGFRADDANGAKNTLTFNGGFLAHQGVKFSSVYQGNRTYKFRSSSSANIVLPNFATLLFYEITRGRYSQ